MSTLLWNDSEDRKDYFEISGDREVVMLGLFSDPDKVWITLSQSVHIPISERRTPVVLSTSFRAPRCAVATEREVTVV